MSVKSLKMDLILAQQSVLLSYRYKLDLILFKLDNLLGKEEQIIMDLTALTNQVKANTDAEASAVILLQGLSAKLTQFAGDPAQINALATQLNTSAAALAAAIVANTPSA